MKSNPILFTQNELLSIQTPWHVAEFSLLLGKHKAVHVANKLLWIQIFNIFTVINL